MVIAEATIPTHALVRGLQAGGAQVRKTDDPSVLTLVNDAMVVFVSPSLLAAAMEAIGLRRWRVFVLCPTQDETALEIATNDPRVGGFLAVGDGGIRPFEIHYLTRRLRAPNEPPPYFTDCLGWGVTTFMFQPQSTEDQRGLVERVESMGNRLGVRSKHLRALATAVHELTMNAMYDAPIDSQGTPLYAHDRTAELSLTGREVPTLRVAISTDYLALDIVDSFGRLPRRRWFEAVLRGHRNLKYNRSDLDTSHGGAGLGLHTLYTSGCLLRAELQPNNLTHVSWMLDRRVRASAADAGRSLYFLPYIPAEPTPAGPPPR